MKLLTVGRISPVKGLEDLIGSGYPIRVIGEPTDKDYFEELKTIAKNTTWLGGLSQDEILKELRECDLFVSNSHTGSLDKACLEAMACGKLILTSNSAVKSLLKQHGDGLAEMLTFSGKLEFEHRVLSLLQLTDFEKQSIGQELRRIIVENHSLQLNIKRIIDLIES